MSYSGQTSVRYRERGGVQCILSLSFFFNPLNIYIEENDTAHTRTHSRLHITTGERRPHQTHSFDTPIYRSLVWHDVFRLSLTGVWVGWGGGCGRVCVDWGWVWGHVCSSLVVRMILFLQCICLCSYSFVFVFAKTVCVYWGWEVLGRGRQEGEIRVIIQEKEVVVGWLGNDLWPGSTSHATERL